MKKFITLLLLTITAFTFKTQAQVCNAEFSVQYLSNFNVKFNPVVTLGSPTYQHIWNFGDGSPVSNLVSPTHTYAAPGSYATVHTIIRYNANNVPECTQSFTKLVNITPECNLVVDFSWTSTAANPLIVAFTNLSVPLAATDSITWNFGDNTSSHDVNPVHSYANAGTYNVCLIVKKWPVTTNAPCIKYICKTVVVTAPCTLVANFSWTVAPANPLSIQFNNLSVPLSNTDSIRWTFGDGISSNQVNPLHVYAAAGTYTVCLRIIQYNTGSTTPCIREICKTVVVTHPCTLQAYFSSQNDPVNPLKVYFANQTVPISPSDSVRWNFGDGTSISGLQSDPNIANPVHIYAAAGVYMVCIRVKKNNITTPNQCVSEFCKQVGVTEPCTLTAYFSSQPDPNNPFKVYFTNQSVPSNPTDSVRWTFGDGTSISGLQSDPNVANPIHIYANAGSYNVCIRVKKNNNSTPNQCVREFCKTVVVTAACTLVADFSSQPVAGQPLKIQFTNLSTPSNPSDSLKWTFGDGSTLTGLQSDPNVANPLHQYSQQGVYSVCLRVKKNNNTTANICVREICKTITLIEPCTLVANFSSQALPGSPLSIKFTNLSTPSSPTDSLRWTFGDGSSLAGLQSDPNVANPIHQYSQAGNYNVCLRVKKNNSVSNTNTCIREICHTVVVTHPCNFQASFTWRLDSANNRKVYFTNTTAAPTATSTATWSFGDGTTATTWNAIHEYAQPGRYYVCLRVEAGPNCIRYFCDSVTVPPPPPPCNNMSNFNFIRATNNSQTYTFIPVYQSAGVQYTWTFGDGTGSHDMIATHHYAQPGNYTVCLTVWRSASCASTTCKSIQVAAQINCDTVHVTYTYHRDPQVPNKIYFNAVSNLPILDQTWTITRLPASTNYPPVVLHQNNPVYTFADTGTYRVCLRAITLGGCVKEFCNEIRVTSLGSTNACTLTAFPNPASTVVNVNVYLTQPEMIHTYVYNSLNVLLMDKHEQGTTGNNLVTLNVSTLPVGQYIMKVIYGNRTCYGSFQKL